MEVLIPPKRASGAIPGACARQDLWETDRFCPSLQGRPYWTEGLVCKETRGERGELGPHCCAGNCGEGSRSRCWLAGMLWSEGDHEALGSCGRIEHWLFLRPLERWLCAFKRKQGRWGPIIVNQVTIRDIWRASV